MISVKCSGIIPSGSKQLFGNELCQESTLASPREQSRLILAFGACPLTLLQDIVTRDFAACASPSVFSTRIRLALSATRLSQAQLPNEPLTGCQCTLAQRPWRDKLRFQLEGQTTGWPTRVSPEGCAPNCHTAFGRTPFMGFSLASSLPQRHVRDRMLKRSATLAQGSGMGKAV